MTWGEHLELIARILVGTGLGAVVGFERDRRHRPAGLRTHALVGLASATFMVVSTHFFFFQNYSSQELGGLDASKIAAAVVAGIGFLAGGAILRNGLSVQGLTTAAGLWLVAAIGLAAGAGMYLEALTATVVGEVVLLSVRKLEATTVHRRVSLTLERAGPSVDEVVTLLQSLGAQVERRDYARDSTGNRHAVLEMSIETPALMEKARAALEERAGITRLRIEVL